MNDQLKRLLEENSGEVFPDRVLLWPNTEAVRLGEVDAEDRLRVLAQMTGGRVTGSVVVVDL